MSTELSPLDSPSACEPIRLFKVVWRVREHVVLLWLGRTASGERLVSENLAGDDENRENEQQNEENSNKEGNTSSNVADEQAQISTNDGHDDIDLLAGDARGTTGTNKSSFYDVEGRMVPVSADTHYLH